MKYTGIGIEELMRDIVMLEFLKEFCFGLVGRYDNNIMLCLFLKVSRNCFLHFSCIYLYLYLICHKDINQIRYMYNFSFIIVKLCWC